MTEPITDHAYVKGPFGRCSVVGCNRREPAHAGPFPFRARISVVQDVPPEPPPTVGLDTTLLETDLAVSTIPVSLHQKRGEKYEVDWPGTWPLPIAGQLVRIDDKTLTVRQIEFHLDRERIVINCD